MRIGIDLSHFVADQRGMGRVVRSILQQWLQNSQDEYCFWIRKTVDSEPLSRWIQQMKVEADWRIISWDLLAEENLDVCWYPWNRIDRLPKSGRKIVTINDVNPFVFPYRSLWRWWDQRQDERRFQRAASMADRIVTISEFSRQEIIRYLGVTADKIAVMPLGVDETWFATDMEEMVEVAEKAAKGPPLLLYVGSDDERKNLPTLLEGVSLLQNRSGHPYRLMCCGVGEDKGQKYAERLRRLDLERSVQFTGFVPDDQLRQLYRQADLFVFPSRYEGFGLPLLEAMAAGLPVVSSKAASLPEVGGDAAVYFDPDDPADLAATLHQTWQDSALRLRLTELGRIRARSFSWKRAAASLRDHLEDAR